MYIPCLIFVRLKLTCTSVLLFSTCVHSPLSQIQIYLYFVFETLDKWKDTGRAWLSKKLTLSHFPKPRALVQRFFVHPVYTFFTQSKENVGWCRTNPICRQNGVSRKNRCHYYGIWPPVYLHFATFCIFSRKLHVIFCIVCTFMVHNLHRTYIPY